jgi:hypothetical protein
LIHCSDAASTVSTSRFVALRGSIVVGLGLAAPLTVNVPTVPL